MSTSSCSEKKSKGNNMELVEILRENALRYLPAKALYRCLSVCRDWKLKISTPIFNHNQSMSFRLISGLFIQSPGRPPSFLSLDQMAYGVPDPELSFLPEPVDVRASSNGLLCCQGRTGDMAYYVCNPVNQQWKEIPKPRATAEEALDPAVVLVFEPSLMNYVAKYGLLRMFPCRILDQTYEFEMYFSARDVWMRRDKLLFSEESAVYSGGLCLNGYAYWPGKPWKIIGFNVRTGLPMYIYENRDVNEYIFSYGYQYNTRASLGVMNGKLCWTFAYLWRIAVYEYDGKHVNTKASSWKIKHHVEFNVDDFNVSSPSVEPQVLTAWDNIVVFQVERTVYSYNLVTRQTINVCNGPDISSSHVFPYVNNLVSLI